MTDTTSRAKQSGARQYLSELWGRRQFTWYLATTNLKSQYASTSLGIVWWVLNPLLLTGVYFLVFGVIFAGGQRGNAAYLGYLMAGMFAFRFTSGVVSGGTSTIVGNSQLMANLRFPRLLLPISNVIESGIGFLVSIVAFFAIILPLTRDWPGWLLLWFIPIFLLQVTWNVGLSALTARITVPHRDVAGLIPFLVRLWLYLSPIIWTLDRLEDAPEWVSTLVHLNPMFYFLSVYRTALLGWELESRDLMVAAVCAVAIGVVGIASFVRYESRLIQEL
ncbi:MAG: ABC transporter permease [Actinomycetota bacterium]